MSRYFTARIRENIPLNSTHNLITLTVPNGTVEPLPGQFYMIEVNRGNDPLLKRAFSLFRRTPDGFQLLYRIQGRGTALLREMKRDDAVSVLGPLGSHYPLPSEEQLPLVIAGGIGIASVFPFLLAHQKKAAVFYGARSAADLFLLDELRNIAKEVYISSDDGTLGEKGTVVARLDRYLSDNRRDIGRYVVYACGPQVMLKAVSGLAAAQGIAAYVSLEEHMACGLGACLGCVVMTTGGYQRVCKEGPVFRAEDIIW